MINREIPFRPRLEGDFRVRFYDAASSITEHTPLSKIEHKPQRCDRAQPEREDGVLLVEFISPLL